MTNAQQRLVDRTLAVIGSVSFILLVLALVKAIHTMVSNNYDLDWFITGLFDWDDGGRVFFPLSILGFCSFLLRAYIRAGREP